MGHGVACGGRNQVLRALVAADVVRTSSSVSSNLAITPFKHLSSLPEPSDTLWDVGLPRLL